MLNINDLLDDPLTEQGAEVGADKVHHHVG